MNLFDDSQALREEEKELYRLALDAFNEALYTTAEQFLEHAVAIAQRLDDLPLLVKVRGFLAGVQSMQSKHIQALTTSTWLIGVAIDSKYSHLLTDKSTLWTLTGAFIVFIQSGSYLPEVPIKQLLQVVDDGHLWVERIGKTEWLSGIRLFKAKLLRMQGNLEEARLEMETGVALLRRHPNNPCITLEGGKLLLAELLNEETIGVYSEAIELAEEVLKSNSIYDRCQAYKILGYGKLCLGEQMAALDAAHKSLSLACTTDNRSVVAEAYQLLGKIYREIRESTKAAAVVAQQWRWARLQGSVLFRTEALIDCARVRLLQAHEACSFFNISETMSKQLVEVNHFLATRCVQSVRRFIGWAYPLATQLDRASEYRKYQSELDKLTQEINQLADLLMKWN